MASQLNCVDFMEIAKAETRKIENVSQPAGFDDILRTISNGAGTLKLSGLTPSALSYVISKLQKELNRPIFLVTPTEKEAKSYRDRLQFFLGIENQAKIIVSDEPLLLLPSIMKSSLLHSVNRVMAIKERIEFFYTMLTSSEGKIYVSSAEALLEKSIPKEILLENVEYLVQGEEIDREVLVRSLVERGYYFTSLVEEPGDASVRGGILDIYPPLYRYPVRLEFFDDTIDSIRIFVPATQKSVEIVEDVIILPVSEIILGKTVKDVAWGRVLKDLKKSNMPSTQQNHWLSKLQTNTHFIGIERLISYFYPCADTLVDYLQNNLLVVFCESWDINRQLHERWDNAGKEYQKALYEGEWTPSPEHFLEEPNKIISGFNQRQSIFHGFYSLDSQINDRVTEIGVRTSDNQDLISSFQDQPKRERFLEPLVERLNALRDDGMSTFLVCSTAKQAQRMAGLLENYDVGTQFTDKPFGDVSWESTVVKVLVGHLDKGFSWPRESFAIITEDEIFGTKIKRRQRKRVAGILLNSFSDLSPGDSVVHIDHGIGIYRGIRHMVVDDVANDFLVIEYLNEDRLYLPIDRIHRVQKYLGIDDVPPRLDRLGGKSWESSKKKAEESIRQMAEELLQISALRQVKDGFSFSPPDNYFKEFESTFPFEETPDQIEAITDVLEDMAHSQPMDRLVCGDVGFGKTEVAIRASFKAVMDGKQVAMLVPTTILAEQHFQTFRERFLNYPVFVEVLSRFKTRKQQQQVINDVKNGKIDVLIGTHRLLQKDIVFRDLGLLIIDEEHRFGVRHKERLKKMRTCVDVLSLSATPIPRTLHISLMGIRDLSTIETPPQERYGIETHIYKFDEDVIKTAILNELNRAGQVFFVHNRVKSIYNMANFLQKLVPDARIGVAHGKMQERELEKVMGKFIRKKIDVLVCSTIIESGLDIPLANTIIINRADKFGLAQIYQLRGRVGRSNRQAYAYLLVPGKHLITRQAQRRFRALLDFSDIGSGFKIALNDLQIRGGGNLLGAAQSGHVAAIGYELYLELVQKAIKRLKGETVEEPPEPEINIKLSAYIPERYVPDTNQRLLIYKRLAGSKYRKDIKEIANEMRDRYGTLPLEVQNLLNVSLIKQWLRKLYVKRLVQNQQHFIVQFAENFPLDSRTLFEIAAKFPRNISFGSENKLIVSWINGHKDNALEFLKLVLQKLVINVRDNAENVGSKTVSNTSLN